jgi:hypothetical protein
MSRPCQCGNAAVGPFARGMCRVCWLALNDERYAAMWSGQTPPPAAPPSPAKRKALPCAHAGDPAGPLGFHLCDHPDEPLGKAVVCACQGCGPRCAGYAPAELPLGQHPPPS